MKSPELALRIASTFAAAICAAQLFRLIVEIPVKIGPHEVGAWPSAIAVVVAGTLSVWFWQLAGQGPKVPPPV